MTKKTSQVRNAGSALDMLVRQFSQPLACLRELVQNAIDAGSNQIDVTLVHDPEEKCLKLSVADTGEGMTEEIIQTQLTRLFSSSKENDLTKVGKFGIGFVSVFSLDPSAVVVDTGREGQSWRVLFDAERKFDLIKLPDTQEGTTVCLYIPESRYKLPALLQEVEKTLTFWCRHCKVQILVNGKSIQQPLSLEAPFQIAYEEPGTRLVVAATPSSEGFCGYYNQGLTLLEGTGSPVPHLTFKVDSRYFEHTLTRDNIIRDANYEKAMTLLRRVAVEKYPKKLFEQLRQTDRNELWALLEVLPKFGVALPEIEAAPLFSDHQQGSYSLASLKGQEIFYQEQADLLQAAVHNPKGKRIVLKLSATHPGLAYLKKQLNVSGVAACWGFCEAQQEQPIQSLLAVHAKLRARLGARSLLPVRWLAGPRAEFLRRAPQVGLVRWDQPIGGDLVLINVDHPVYQPLLHLARWSPALACQVLLQHLLLLQPESEREALSHALSEGVLEQLA